MFCEAVFCPGSQNATSLGSSPGAGLIFTALTQICWRRRPAVPASSLP
jgi:hypothetical protein